MVLRAVFYSTFFLLCLVSFELSAQAVRYYKIPYIVQDNDNLSRILRRFVYDDSVINQSTPLVRRTQISNPSVTNWENLQRGARIDLYISEDFLDQSKLSRYQAQMRERVENLRQEVEVDRSEEATVPRPIGLKGSVFYMASYGLFTQTGDNLPEIDFQQNSPVTLGSSFSFYPETGPLSYAWSAYFSHLVAASNSLDDSIIDIPLEVGLNFYTEYRFERFRFTGYAGLDYERFHTFNLQGIVDEGKIFLDENKVLYLTVGATGMVNVFQSSFLTKLSLSASLSSSTTAGYDDGLNENFSGFKALWYVNKKISEHFYVHTLLKYHQMSGPSELSTFRIGVGVGYILF